MQAYMREVFGLLDGFENRLVQIENKLDPGRSGAQFINSHTINMETPLEPVRRISVLALPPVHIFPATLGAFCGFTRNQLPVGI
jgi:hypothetical protein